MHIIDRVKKDIEILSKIDNKRDKYIYIWDYYKVFIVGVILILSITLITILTNIGKDKKILYVVLLNNDSSIIEVDESVFINELNKGGIDTYKKSVDVNNYLSLGSDPLQDAETLQVLSALFSITDLDIYVSDKEYFDMFIEKDAFCDLSLLIDKDILNKYKDDLYTYKNSDGIEIVGGIVLHNDSIIHKAGYYHDDVIIGATSNGVNLDNALILIEQILSD